MNPYYQDDYVTLYHGDCREIVPTLGRFDLCLTDMPYGIGDGATRKNKYLSYSDTQSNLIDLINTAVPDMLSQCSVTALTPGVNNITKYPEPTWILCLIMDRGAGSTKWGFNQWQPLMVYGGDPYLKAGKGRRPDTIKWGNEPIINFGHPCSKPLRLWSRVLERVGFGAQTILDPFAGSGTTGRAAKDLGRKCTMIEISEKYCEIAANRCRQEVLPFGIGGE